MDSKTYPAIILAGGLGTRLRSVINDLPKPMAPVNGYPFLHYIFLYLAKQGIQEVILSVGYKYEAVKDFFGEKYKGIKVQYSIENEPLGTGGAIKKAFEMVEDFAFVLNGDTFFDVDLNELRSFYFHMQSDVVLALKQLENFDRYGTVYLNENGRITEFFEKRPVNKGLINGGAYFANKKVFGKIESAEKFSFEKDVLEKYLEQLKFNGKIFNGYFVDIGIPDDYQKVQKDFSVF